MSTETEPELDYREFTIDINHRVVRVVELAKLLLNHFTDDDTDIGDMQVMADTVFEGTERIKTLIDNRIALDEARMMFAEKGA